MKYVKLFESWLIKGSAPLHEAEDISIINPSKFASMLKDAVKRAESIGSDKGKRMASGEKVDLRFDKVADQIAMGVIEKFYPADIKDLGSNSQVYTQVRILVETALHLAYDRAYDPKIKTINGLTFNEREEKKNQSLDNVIQMYSNKHNLYSDLYRVINKEDIPSNIVDILNTKPEKQTAPEEVK